MSNLFSVFDPSALLGLKLNWVVMYLVIFILPKAYWVSKTQLSVTLVGGLALVKEEFKSVTGRLNSPGLIGLSMAYFLCVLLVNILGVLPYVFTPTSHLCVTLSLALPFWLGLTVYSWVNSTQNTFAHLVPAGSPLFLSPVMVLIELSSGFIRPITLSVRLTANMVAGHLLMALLSGPLPSLSLGLSLLVMMALIVLVALESGVALIQAYVFSVLTVLYLNESNTVKLVK